MERAHWFLIFGLVFIGMGLLSSTLRRLSLTSSLLYLALGVALGPHGLGMIRVDARRDAQMIEWLSEIVVIVSLFTAGLKLRSGWKDPHWRLVLRLAFLSMAATVALITAAGVGWLGLPLGAAILLGAILAPTDAVLASEVQVRDPEDRDRLRFSLTGEAGLNDGTAFPLVLLGLGLLGLRDLGAGGWAWATRDVLWAVFGGLAIGGLLGTGMARLVFRLRKRNRESGILDDFIAVGLIALSYGLALATHSYGFLAVFAAGLSLRHAERRETGVKIPEEIRELATIGEHGRLAPAPGKAPAYTAQAVLFFNEQLERIGEVGMVILVGAALRWSRLHAEDVAFALVLFFVIRPLAVWALVGGFRRDRRTMGLIGWFGIRGIGSIYYLSFAVGQGLPAWLADRMISITWTTVAISIVIHGISATPLLKRHARKSALEGRADASYGPAA